MADKLLEVLGKRRAVFLPDTSKGLGPYTYVQAKKESFLKALLRPKDLPLADGWIYVDDLVSSDVEQTD